MRFFSYMLGTWAFKNVRDIILSEQLLEYFGKAKNIKEHKTLPVLSTRFEFTNDKLNQ